MSILNIFKEVTVFFTDNIHGFLDLKMLTQKEIAMDVKKNH